MSKNMYMDIHIIQTVPPSCINRDDTGSPKTAYYGGSMRARVSSQAWKRAVRLMFADILQTENAGMRTRNSVQLTARAIVENNPDISEEDAMKMAAEALELAGVKAGSDKKDVLFFISSKQVEAIAKIAVEYASLGKAEKKSMDKRFKEKANEALTREPAIDMLLFGRMAANNPSLNYDAAAQVAHSISTHAISNEYDYFTAVDDFGTGNDSGAGHIGTVEFNSSTLYRYASVNLRELSVALTPKEVAVAASGFAQAFIRSMPSGKQNSFANRTLPDLVYVTLRTDQNINLAGAFEKPISAQAGGYAQKSEDALFAYAQKVYEDYAAMPQMEWVIGTKEGRPGKNVNIRELTDEIMEAAELYAAGGE